MKMMGVKIDKVDGKDIPSVIFDHLHRNEQITIFNVNTHAMNIAYHDEEFRGAINQADLIFSDGFGVNLAAKILGVQIGGRATYADSIDDILSFCAQNSKRVYVLGDVEELLDVFVDKAIKRHPKLVFAGTHHGFFAKTGPESDTVVEHINNSGADVLMLAMSMPIQEKWCHANKQKLGPTVMMSIGGLPRIYVGWIARGPAWMTNNGLEWFYRLMVQREKVFKRYVLGNPLFLFRAFLTKLGLIKFPPN
jgi:N-acetylglucosaminyldiphosphoundecaprenol N-acetyl-beta-D-mannosaminyltransferase